MRAKGEKITVMTGDFISDNMLAIKQMEVEGPFLFLQQMPKTTLKCNPKLPLDVKNRKWMIFKYN